MTGPAAVPGRPVPASRPFPWPFLLPLYLGSALNPVNSSLIATALVPMSRGVHVSIGQTAVLVSALYLTSAIAQPTAGKLAEVFGPRRVFLIGIVLVGAGGIVGGVGDSLAALIIARVLVGIGTSGGYPSAMLMIRRRAEDRGLSAPPGGVLGGLQIAGTATSALGLPVGGLIVAAFGWRATFLVNVPLTTLAFVLAILFLPRDGARGPLHARAVLARIDLPGLILFATTLTAVLVFLDALPGFVWPALVAAAVLGTGLVVWELRAVSPFLDVRLLLRNLPLTRTYLRYGLTSLCVYTVFYGVSSWLEAGHDLSSQTVGFLMLPLAVLSAVVIHPVARHNLIRSALIVSGVASLAGSTAILFVGSTTPLVLIVLITLTFGITLGTFAPANQTALYLQADPTQIGSAAGLMRTSGYIGSIASSAIIGVAFQNAATDASLHSIAAIMVGVSVVGLLLTLLDRRLGRRVVFGERGHATVGGRLSRSR